LSIDLFTTRGGGLYFLNKSSSIIGEIYDEFHKDVYHFSLYYTNNKQDAEDITQETFIKVFNNLHQIKDPSKKKTWILSIARNTAVDLIRKQKLIGFLPKIIMQNTLTSKQVSNSGNVVAEENWLELQKALLKLKPHYRSVVILRALNELSIKETAETLRCSEGKVRVDFHRALNQLKNDVSLKERWEDFEQSR
jgi:RNA polymerase sigma-70 factor (ECF subfamily)